MFFRAALMTGRYSVRSGIYPMVFFPDHIGGLPSTERTLPALLKPSGYTSLLVGKWHLGGGLDNEYHPTKRGWDQYYGVPPPFDLCPTKTCFYPNVSCHDEGVPEFVSCPLYDGETIIEQPVDFLTVTDRYTDRGISFIRENSRKSQPFLLFMSYHQTHHPQFAGKEFYGKSERGTFGDALMEMDNSIGLIMRALEKYKVIEDTLVWFTSDNG